MVLGVTVLVFALNAAALGDPARAAMGQRADPETLERLRREYALDRPLPVQYATWLARLARADLGESFREQRPVREVIVERLPATARLALAATLVSVVFGIGIGAIAAVRARSTLDHVLMGLAVLGISTPVFWLGLMGLYIFWRQLGWTAGTGYVSPADSITGFFSHMILPWIVLALLYAAFYARMTRNNLLETLGEDYIRTARAKGLSERKVIFKHGLRASLTPIVTMFGLDIALLVGGAIITESVFNLQGLGYLAINNALQQDLPIVLGVVLVTSVAVALANLIVDILYAFIDPRVRYA